jgi:hypothetical protein
VLHIYPIDIDATISSLIFWNQIVEIKKGKKNLNCRHMRIHQFMDSDDEDGEMQRCINGESSLIIFNVDSEM